ncbi:MAG: D-amino-acid transaminase, partial [Hyphomicrobium sp.]
IEDRGYQFADGAYEVIAVQHGSLVDEQEHLDRLHYSLRQLRISWPMSARSMQAVMRELLRRNAISRRGVLYLQVTRGVAPRNHAFPQAVKSCIVMTARVLPPIDPVAARRGVGIIIIPDLRWKRPDIKSVSLLPNVLGKQQAIEAGAYEAWMTDEEGRVTEGTTSNAWIVVNGTLVTRQADRAILNGITRRAVLRIAAEHGIAFVERPFTVAEAIGASEAFTTSTTALLKPVIKIGEDIVGDGRIGPLTSSLLDFYIDHMNAVGQGQ